MWHPTHGLTGRIPWETRGLVSVGEKRVIAGAKSLCRDREMNQGTVPRRDSQGCCCLMTRTRTVAHCADVNTESGVWMGRIGDAEGAELFSEDE